MKSAPILTPWARPWDVQCAERTRFPQPVAHRRITPLGYVLAGACGGAVLMAASTLLLVSCL